MDQAIQHPERYAEHSQQGCRGAAQVSDVPSERVPGDSTRIGAASPGSLGQFGDLLASHGVRQSLSRLGQCWDNSVVESFYSTLKTELVHRQTWANRAQARQAIFEFVEVF